VNTEPKYYGRAMSVVDPDLVIAKAEVVERSVARVREEYAAAGAHFATDLTRQDAAILNLQRASVAVQYMARHIVRSLRLGWPNRPKDAFDFLSTAGWIDARLASRMHLLCEIPTLAGTDHDDLEMVLPMIVDIIEKRLNGFTEFTHAVLKQMPHYRS
jgi:uncharacterized protein YutE (UPF0331/DUF86 family)